MAVDTERRFRTIAGLSVYPVDALICVSATEVFLLTGYWPVMAASVVIFASSGQAQVIPGVKEGDVDHAVRYVMEAAGFGKTFTHAAGHGVGFAAANPDGRPRIHPLSPDVLESGMTFNLEPAAYFKGSCGMRHCDVIALTPVGATTLTDF